MSVRLSKNKKGVQEYAILKLEILHCNWRLDRRVRRTRLIGPIHEINVSTSDTSKRVSGIAGLKIFDSGSNLFVVWNSRVHYIQWVSHR
jgi:hypothetical protein